tara:strand:- start:1369 stop:2139 length:771 start_codon:yes stop_codon:yes gene_type:complete
MNLTNIQNQFNDHPEKYVRSPCFATGESLEKMIELLHEPKINRALDVATGGGHTAKRLCSISDYVVAGDVTVSMLKAARELMGDNKAGNVSCCQHDAHMLPFPKQTFDLVTCRIAPHHFTDVLGFLEEVVRVSRPGAAVGIIDSCSPVQPSAARHINAFERLRDTSHNHSYTCADWKRFFYEVGLKIEYMEQYKRTLSFSAYCDRKSISVQRRTQLKVMLFQAPEEALKYLNPRNINGDLVFDLQEVCVVGRTIVG